MNNLAFIVIDPDPKQEFIILTRFFIYFSYFPN